MVVHKIEGDIVENDRRGKEILLYVLYSAGNNVFIFLLFDSSMADK